MKKNNKYALIVIAVNLLVSCIDGQDTTRMVPANFANAHNYPPENKVHYIGLRIYHENDFIVPTFLSRKIFKNTDDNYTGGLKAEIITNIFDVKKIFIFNPLRGKISSLSFVFGVTAFTPQDLKNTAIIYNDRPYASYRYWGLGVSSVSRDTAWKLSYELEFGAMGRPAAGDAQTYIHHHHFLGSNRPEPQGWKYQIAFDGAFAFNLQAKLEHKIWISKLIGRNQNFRWIQLSGKGEMNLGQYVTNLAVEPRISLFNWNHNLGEFEDEPTLPLFFSENSSRNLSRTRNKAGFHVFLGLRPRFLIHNATLTGDWLGKSSVNTVPISELNRLLFEYDFGFVFRWCFFRIGYNLFGRSKEFSYQNKDFHNWGGVYLGFIFRFK